MATSAPDRTAHDERQWFIVGRFEEFEGEGRANLLRAIGLAAFYAVELLNYFGLRIGALEVPPVVNREFHLAMTMLVLAWAMLCLAVLLCRKNGIFPEWLKFVSTGCDLLLLTSVLTLADGPRSPLLVGYFLILAVASLRFSLRLIWFATGGAIAGYLFLLGNARWGSSVEGWERGDVTVPRYHQLIFVLALVLTGVVLGQLIRRVRALAEGYARRMARPPGGKS
ncbi:MAG: hypothetical protein U0797_10385 [Gemmataceae bacterium]